MRHKNARPLSSVTLREQRDFEALLNSSDDLASMITANAELGCIHDINDKLPTPRELVASWGKSAYKDWAA